MIPLPFSKPRRLIRLTTKSHFDTIEASLARREEEMTRLDTKIARLKYKLVSLAKEQKLIKETYPPINKLSPEVLQEIFILCLPPWSHAVLTAREAPLLLCRVCHSWRQLAHATPRLWCSIHFPLRNDTETPVPSPDDINSWLSHSKSLPLSISLFYLANPRGSPLEPYLEAMASMKGRWRSLHVATNTAFDMVKYLLAIDNKDELCSLEELYIYSKYRGGHSDQSCSPFELLLKIPKLRSLTLPFDGFTPLQPDVDGTKLTQLGITRPFRGTYDLDEVAEILSWVPRLQSLSISGFRSPHPFTQWSFSTQAIHLSDLETLSITDYKQPHPVWEFLKALHTPRLRHWRYHLTLSSHPFASALTPVAIFLSRLLQPLEELDLLLQSHGVEFRPFLDLLPNLKRLSLEKFIDYSDFLADIGIICIGNFHLSCLAEDSAQFPWSVFPRPSLNADGVIEPSSDTTPSYCCPQLEVIKCICQGESVSDNILIKFLRRRTGEGAKAIGVTPLKKVDIRVESQISDELRETVHEILDGTGTQFHILSEPLS